MVPHYSLVKQEGHHITREVGGGRAEWGVVGVTLGVQVFSLTC